MPPDPTAIKSSPMIVASGAGIDSVGIAPNAMTMLPIAYTIDK